MNMWYVLLGALLPGVLGLTPDDCDYVMGSEAEFQCNFGDSMITIGGKNDYVKIYCDGNNITCPNLPRLNFARGLPLKSLGIWSCPTHLLQCVDEVLNATSISLLTLTMMTSPLIEEDVRHLQGVTVLMIIQAAAQKSMPIAAINSLPKLKDLRIGGGDFQLSSDMFAHASLEYLELHSDNIRSIPVDTFRGLQGLKELNVWGNSIDQVKVGAFNGLENLRALSLNSNKLKFIEPGTFSSIPKLGSLQINDNQMTLLPINLLEGLEQLENVTIFLNRKNLVLDNTTFSKLNNLKNIDLRNNGIQILPDKVFHNSTSVERLELSKNDIVVLPSSVFSRLAKLKYINLSYNKLRQLPEDVFFGLNNLQYLNLNRNHLESLPANLFASQSKLKELYMDNNFISSIAWTSFQGASNLETLSLAWNKLTLESDDLMYRFFEFTSPFQYSVKLKKLNLSNNLIRTIFDDWRMVMVNMEILNLSWNKFTEFDQHQMDFLSSSITVDLRHNNIAHVALTPYLEEFSGNNSSPKKFLLLDHNPIICDCYMYGLKLRSTRFTPKGELKLVIDQAKCVSPPSLKGIPINQVSVNDLLCDIPEYCPNNCECNAKIATSELLINCIDLPEILPDKSSTNFSYYFTKPPTINLQLKVQPNSIENYDIHTLNLTKSNIKELLIKPTKSIKILDLSNNQFSKIPIDFIESNVTLYLGNNSFDCECWYSESISILKKYNLVPDFYAVTCKNGELISNIDVTALCNTMKAAITAISIFAVLAFLFIASIIIIYRYKYEIMLYLSRIFPAGCFEIIQKDSDKDYDVFISFAHQNFDFVDEILLPKLENDFNQKVCVHYRDWVVGELIPTQILQSVANSRKTIIVLSKGFLESVWANLEFSAAHNLALQEGKTKVILILLNEDITKHEKISPELRAYINTNTYIVWGDPKFWSRIQKALPKIEHRFKFVEDLKRKIDTEKNLETGLNVQLNSEGKLVNCAAKNKIPAKVLDTA